MRNYWGFKLIYVNVLLFSAPREQVSRETIVNQNVFQKSLAVFKAPRENV